jgi:LPXTG-site transpeptidase (sortase) family protein
VLPSSTSKRLGAGLLAGAGVLAVTGLALRDHAPEPILFTEPVVIDAPPSTVGTLPPATTQTTVAEPTTPAPAEGRPSATVRATVPATLPTSPLAARLPPRASAVPSAAEAPAPVELWIGDLSLWAPVVSVGLQRDGQLEIPDETEVGWYRFGSSPGRAGSTVLVAHVSWADTIGPFFRLGQLQPGADIKVELSDGTTRRYQVTERAQYPKTELPAERVWTRDGDETLVLITCGGDFNRQIRRYTDNIVIYAVPV